MKHNLFFLQPGGDGDQAQDGLGPGYVLVEGGVEDEDLARPPGNHVLQFRLQPLQREAAHLAVSHAVEAEVAAEGAPPGEGPDDAVGDVAVEQPGGEEALGVPFPHHRVVETPQAQGLEDGPLLGRQPPPVQQADEQLLRQTRPLVVPA